MASTTEIARVIHRMTVAARRIIPEGDGDSRSGRRTSKARIRTVLPRALALSERTTTNAHATQDPPTLEHRSLRNALLVGAGLVMTATPVVAGMAGAAAGTSTEHFSLMDDSTTQCSTTYSALATGAFADGGTATKTGSVLTLDVLLGVDHARRQEQAPQRQRRHGLRADTELFGHLHDHRWNGRLQRDQRVGHGHGQRHLRGVPEWRIVLELHAGRSGNGRGQRPGFTQIDAERRLRARPRQ